MFADEQISFEISEDLRPGHTIGIVNATDPDTIGALSYTLESDDAAKTFELDKSSGVLKLIDTLDREKQDMYKLAVRASDGVQATDTTVLIQVNIHARTELEMKWCLFESDHSHIQTCFHLVSGWAVPAHLYRFRWNVQHTK